MEKESKIQNEQKRNSFKGLMYTAVLVSGILFYELLLGMEVIEKIHWEATYTPPIKHKATEPPKEKHWMPAQSLPELESIVAALDEEVRAIKKTKVIMETDPTSIQKTFALQQATRKLLKAKYGDHEAYRVRVDLQFPKSTPDFAEKGQDGSIVIEMAPLEHQPVSVYNFMEIARTWVRGAFHRNANHVLQVQAISDAIHQPLSFQEYSKEFPHKKGTTGYAGRPSGPGWYVSIQDNTNNHGPGSQQKHNPYEADANFGTVVEGFDEVVPRIHSIPVKGWLKPHDQVKIIKKTILIPDGNGGFKEWEDWTKTK